MPKDLLLNQNDQMRVSEGINLFGYQIAQLTCPLVADQDWASAVERETVFGTVWVLTVKKNRSSRTWFHGKLCLTLSDHSLLP